MTGDTESTRMRLTALVLPTTHRSSFLHRLVIASGGQAVAGRPLPFGTPVPNGANPHVTALGFTLVDEWAINGNGWSCPVEKQA